MDIEEIFKKYEEEFIKFDRIKNKLNNRPDLHAFLLLDQLVPGKHEMVASAEHDEIYLDVDIEDLEKVATGDQIRDLVRCGVRYDGEGLCMFV